MSAITAAARRVDAPGARLFLACCSLMTSLGCDTDIIGPTRLTPGASVEVVSISPADGTTLPYSAQFGNRRYILVEHKCDIPPLLINQRLGLVCEAWLSVDGVQAVGQSVSNGDRFDPSVPVHSSSLFNNNRGIPQTKFVIGLLSSISGPSGERTVYARSVIPWSFSFQ